MIYSVIKDKSAEKHAALLRTVLASEDLPTLPTVAYKLVILTAKEETTLADVAELISQDIALSIKILKVANSAFYSFPQQIGSIQQAVSMLGTNAVQSLVLSFSFLTINKSGDGNQFDFDKFWERSLTSAVASKMILERVPGANAEEILISGLLQNLGELILACAFPAQVESVLKTVEETSIDSRDAEIAVFGADHCFLGYEVARNWSFPESISLPILYHHEPKSYKGTDKQVAMSSKAIYLSGLLLKILYSDNPEGYHRDFTIDAKALLGLESADIEEILQKSHIELGHAAKNFGLKIEKTKPVQEILQEANIRLSLLNLNYEQMNAELIDAKVSLENLTLELQEKNVILKQLADIDGLTQVYNNRFFQAAMDKELSRSVRHKYNLSLVLIDIDHFKKFNDTYGHLVGDFVLAEFSKILTGSLRDYDTLARYGGEEFIVILPETGVDEALRVSDRLRNAVETSSFRDSRDKYKVTASFGVSCFFPEKVQKLGKTDLIRRADEALYDAKNMGRNRVALYAPKKKGWFKKQ